MSGVRSGLAWTARACYVGLAWAAKSKVKNKLKGGGQECPPYMILKSHCSVTDPLKPRDGLG